MGDVFGLGRPLLETDLDERDRHLIDRLAAEIVERGLTAPAILFLELHRPFNFVVGQFMHFISPFASLLFDKAEFDRLACLLEHREALGIIIDRIESMDRERKESR